MASMQKFGGSWSKQKLDVLREYLKPYNTILSKQRFRRYYIDTFAGTGGQIIGNSGHPAQEILPIDDVEHEGVAFLKGSARIALEVEPGFHEFIFSDLSAKKSKHLERLKAEFPNRLIQLRKGDANQVLQDVVSELDWKDCRALVFLDPFGAQVEWRTLELLAGTKAVVFGTCSLGSRCNDNSPAWKD
jgi:three-Cys-motif partner protein